MKRWLTVLSLSLAMLCGCSNTSQHSNSEITAEVTRDIFAMDTYMYLKAYGENAETALGIASERILSLEKTFSVTYENSDTWAINHADGKCVNVSTDTLKILNTAIDIGNKTNGALDITLYPILKAWGFTTDKFTIPSEKDLNELLKYVDYQKISIHNDTVQLDKEMQLDFGALAKGYTSDCVVEILKENKIESALVNLGGNVHALGVKPDGSPWKVAVKNPFSPNEELCILEISDKAVITSGNYERYFTDEDG
ncbi:MAG: FAD:protein FMN transferase, partial [Hominimerdicola sp.]